MYKVEESKSLKASCNDNVEVRESCEKGGSEEGGYNKDNTISER